MVDEVLLRTLTPTVIGILGRRGADFAAAEDAVQEALVEAVRVWPDDPPRDPQGWVGAGARVPGGPGAGPAGLGGHGGLAQVPRRRPRRHLPTAARGAHRRRAGT